MIISASRRTDIPRFYLDWFLNRLEEGYALVRNPMNIHQVSRVPLTKDVVDCIVFWTKNPAPMLAHLEELSAYPYYVQFTLNPYGDEMESGLPKKAKLIETFAALADAIGPQRVVWRYSPVVLNARYTAAYHLHWFDELARRLAPHTRQCKLSFLDMYPKIEPQMRALGAAAIPEAQKQELAAQFAEIAAGHGIAVGACGNLNLAKAGLPAAQCVDAALIEKILGAKLQVKKDPGQRGDCYCAASVDVGAYNTCRNGCRYCYANYSLQNAERNALRYNPASPLLCSTLGPDDTVRERAAKSLLDGQMSLL